MCKNNSRTSHLQEGMLRCNQVKLSHSTYGLTGIRLCVITFTSWVIDLSLLTDSSPMLRGRYNHMRCISDNCLTCKEFIVSRLQPSAERKIQPHEMDTDNCLTGEVVAGILTTTFYDCYLAQKNMGQQLYFPYCVAIFIPTFHPQPLNNTYSPETFFL